MKAIERTGAGVRLENIRKTFGALDVIHGIDLEIRGGEFIVFVGPSGCGKSTLLRMIAGLEDVSDGEISIGDRDVTYLDPSERGIAMVFQSYALYPHMTVRENLGFGLKMAGTPADEIARRVDAAADILKITHLQERGPASSPAASASASPSAAPSSASRMCFSSTNRCRTWMRNCVFPCASRSPSCTARSATR